MEGKEENNKWKPGRDGKLDWSELKSEWERKKQILVH